MKIIAVEAIPASIPYIHQEVSSQVRRDGVTDVLVRVETEDGAVGWGEACSGADVRSVEAAVQAMTPFVVGRDAWDRESIQHDLWMHGLWQFRAGTGAFAFAGIDMALWDACARAAGQPLYRLFGGLRRREVSYFCYLSRGDDDDLRRQVELGLAQGFEVFYLKVGLDDAEDLHMTRTVRDAIGPGRLLRLDANGAWSVPQALWMMDRLRELDIDFIEQPVRDNPVIHLKELRLRAPIRVCANEGLWSEAQAYERIRERQADVYCFSPYWVGSLAAFHRLAHVADYEGSLVCKHTHGEFGLAAAAAQHLLLTLPNVVAGNQQTTHIMGADVLREPLPIAHGAVWGVPEGPGLGVEVDPDAVAEAAERYRAEGQYMPYDAEHLAGSVR
jgi:L-alanine-DL-glutamate epimerase-like enolase superfamily enzyme